MSFAKEPASPYQIITAINDAHKVYLVRHLESGKIYVEKILGVYNPRIYQYLKNHDIEGIPKIYEAYEENDRLIVIEEYVSGSSLHEMADAHLLTEELVLCVMSELCEILERLHSLNPPIVHRDIKPSNIILTPHNHVVLIDFNAAKYMADRTGEDTVLLGTQGYAAPEQYGFGSSTPKTDIYALGILLRELVDSLPAPDGSSAARSHFEDVVKQCTQLRPEDRPETVRAVKNKLENPGKADTWGKFVPPGFRTKTPWKMAAASLSYLFIFWLSLTLDVTDVSVSELWVERCFCLFALLSFVFCCYNYLDIQRFMPLCSGRSRGVRRLGAVLLGIILSCSILVLMCIISISVG